MSETAIDYGSRTMPHDDVAEQSVLGGMLLSKDAIADVVESLRASDFYKPAHETIYEAILLSTVTAALRMRLRLLMS